MKMTQLDINTFHDSTAGEISRRILMKDPVMRVVLVSLRAGQSLSEHAAKGLVTVYSVGGRVLFYEGTGELAWEHEAQGPDRCRRRRRCWPVVAIDLSEGASREAYVEAIINSRT